MSKVDPLKILFYIWLSIALASLVLIIVRTIQFGWFQGKDHFLWVIFFISVYFSYRRKIN